MVWSQIAQRWVSFSLRKLRRLGEAARVRALLFMVRARFAFRNRQLAHGLSGTLVVSLTSYPPRFPVLPNTLRCLLSQKVAADHVVLWIAASDRPELTPEILALQSRGLQIRFCEDIGPYKKLIPSLECYQNAFIVTADDDLFYPADWLGSLVNAYDPVAPREVLCHRMHRIRLDDTGLPLPYSQWDYETQLLASHPLNFPTSGAGVLYPPGALHPDTVNREAFLATCRDADDVWLYWMMRRNNVQARAIRNYRPLISWPGSQRQALFRLNTGPAAGNDRQIKALLDRYGFPEHR